MPRRREPSAGRPCALAPCRAPRPAPDRLPRRVTVVGPPLRVEPLLAARSPHVVLAFTDDPAEAAGADVVVLTEPADHDVSRMVARDGHPVVVVILRAGASRARRRRVLVAGADACLIDPDALAVAAHLHGPDDAVGAEPER